MPKVYVSGLKGMYEVPKEKLERDPDLPFEISAVRGAENTPLPVDREIALEVVDYIPVVEMLRVPVGEEDGRQLYLDVVKAYGDQYQPVGIGYLDERDGSKELTYTKPLIDKSLDEIVLQEGVDFDELLDDLRMLKSDEDLDMLPLSEDKLARLEFLITKDELSEREKGEVVELVREALSDMSAREVKNALPSIRKLVIEGKEVKPEKLQLPVKATPEFLEEKAERLTLNGIMIGADREGNVHVVYTPERVDIRNALEVAKQLNRSPAFKMFQYIAEQRTDYIERRSPEKREKLARKIDEFLAEMDRRGEITEEARDLAERFKAEVLKEKIDKKALAEIIREAAEKKFEEIAKFLQKEPLFKKGDLLAKKGERYFLRNYPANYGIPIIDFRDVKKAMLIGIPRPIKVSGEWQIQESVKPISLVIQGEDGVYQVVPTNSDSYAMFFAYPIWKVIDNFIKRSDEFTWKQYRALLSDGFENWQGLGMLEKKFSENKNALPYIDFIKHIKEVIGDIIYKEDSELDVEKAKKEVAERLSNDPVISEFYQRFAKFLALRGKTKMWRFSEYTKENSHDVIEKLVNMGVIYHKGMWRINSKNLEAHAEEIKGLLKDEWKDKLKPAQLVRRVVMSLNAWETLSEVKAEGKALDDAKILAEDIRNAIEMKVGDVSRKKFTSVVIESWKEREEQPEQKQEPEKPVEKPAEQSKVEEKVEEKKEVEKVEVKIKPAEPEQPEKTTVETSAQPKEETPAEVKTETPAEEVKTPEVKEPEPAEPEPTEEELRRLGEEEVDMPEDLDIFELDDEVMEQVKAEMENKSRGRGR